MKPTERKKVTPVLGDVYMVKFAGAGSEQCGLRPAVIFQNNVGNRCSPNVIVLPLTTSKKKLGQPTHIFVKAANTGLRFDSVVLCENPETVSKDRLCFYITTLPSDVMRKISIGYLTATSAAFFLNDDDFADAKEQSKRLNLCVGASQCITKRERFSS